MNYPIILESLLKEVSKRDFERPILLKVLPELLKPDIPPDIPLIYDKELFPSLKAFFLSKKPFFLEKPYIFHSLLKELKGVFLPSEYKALKELLHEGELKLTLDEGSDKLNALKFEGIETGYIERVKGLFSIMEKGDKEAAKELLKKLGFIKRNKDNKEYREFENIKGDNFKDYIDEIFKEYYSNLKRFPLEFKKLAINTIEVLNDFKLIPSEQKEKLFNRKEKYQKNFEEIREKVLIGGEILQKVFLSLGLKIKKKEKEATMKNYKGLLEILQGFGFEKMDIKEPNFIYFGSFKSGFALKASDIDTTILTNTAFNERDLLTPLLEYLKEYKIKRNSEMKDKSKLLTYELEDRAKLNIRIPIIKFIDKEKDFKADIAVNNVLGVANSTLLKVFLLN